MKTDIIEDLLYQKSHSEVVQFLSACCDSHILHIFTFNYNWGNGFEAPNIIIENPHCSLGTALTLFYLADGYRYLTEKKTFLTNSDWLTFISKLYHYIILNKFKNTAIAFSPPLSKVQAFKLRKILNEKEKVFLKSIEGVDYNITV